MCTRQRRVLHILATTLLVEIFTVTRWIFQLVLCKKFLTSCDDMRIYVQVAWGQISMVDAERRLLAHALIDPDNQHFVLLSDR